MNPSRLTLERLNIRSPLVVEVAVRLVLAIICHALEFAHPFQWTVKQEELWLYKNPHLPERLPVSLLLMVGIGVPSAFILVHYFATGDRSDLVQALLGLSLAVLLTGIINDTIKVCVGRPRPDFYYRCFPDGEMTSDLKCLGEDDTVEEGRKSFPSGHTGWSFCCSGFLALYLSGKLQIFRPPGRGQAWRLCVVLAPLLVACTASLTRIQDYKHHWEDVTVGGIIGLLVSLLCYLQYYPNPLSNQCDSPLVSPYYSTRIPSRRKSKDEEFV